MLRNSLRTVTLLLIGVAMPMAAHAHSQHEAMSLGSGFMHPILGPDHLLAMLSVGIVSALIGGGAIYWVPSAFVASMIVGAVAGVLGVSLPYAEFGIALSVLLLGVAIATPRRFPVIVTMVVVGLFGMFHGNAHGVEMPIAAMPAFYGLGFVISTTLIHIAGVAIGLAPWLHHRQRLPMSAAGFGIAVAGAHFLFQAVA